MSTIDIRSEDNKSVNKIVFADWKSEYRSDQATYIYLGKDHPHLVFIEANDPFCGISYTAVGKKDVHSLIKALQKAVELGWAD